ncbi:hypothetical protein CORC01_00097 [Colletotrichum orchidophilum]|uniref:MARVEL domain-containing protein n=1 Tax=Colletotrichum orchidophilum TaxID=1209926 RepID=A0A1G4BTH0_9PEZI|nr:uncharacterized protein CORC01_00097 [Colletotrichum orchidophilum]OHF04626.1 hypothetical protein CORC01_00097 [Colletotrichum orchidophilum]
MLFAVLFAATRFFQIITLIPTMGMLAWFVDGFVKHNVIVPDSILVLFIVSVLALAWAIFTLFSYHRSSTNALFVAVIDLGFVGAFIAAVWYLRGINYVNCTNLARDGRWAANFPGLFTISGPRFNIFTDKPCAMLKASWVFGIINTILFFFTAVLAWMHGDRLSSSYERKSYHHGRHRRHRSHSHRSHSRRSSHSHSHSHRRVYV